MYYRLYEAKKKKKALEDCVLIIMNDEHRLQVPGGSTFLIWYMPRERWTQHGRGQ